MNLITKLKFIIATFILKILKLILNIDENLVLKFKRKEIVWNSKINDAIGLSLFLFGSFEQKLLGRVSKLQSSGIIIDIGANIGTFSIIMNKIKGNNFIQTICYEACSDNFKILQKNIVQNKLRNKIIPKNLIISKKKKKIVSQYPIISKKKNNSIFNGIVGKSQFTKVANLPILKKFKNKKCILKIDTDGDELNVLKASERFIDYHLPLIVVEISKSLITKKSLNQIIFFLIKKKYKLLFMNKFLVTPKLLKYDFRNLGIDYILVNNK